MGKKQAAYVIFAKLHRKKYEGNRKLTVPELIALASPDWKALPPAEKEKYKLMAKDMRCNQQSSETMPSFKNETSNHRLDTEGPTLSCIEIENRTNYAKDELRNTTNEIDLTHANLYFLDVQTYVNRKDGTFVPAELAVMRLIQSDGACAVTPTAAESYIITAEKNDYLNLAREALIEAPERHGIDLDKLGSYPITKTTLRDKLIELIRNNVVFICQGERFRETVGVLYYLKLKNLRVTAIEDYVIQVTDKYSSTQITHALCSNRFDFIKNMRCAFHNDSKQGAQDKQHCSLKNVLKFQNIIQELLDNPPG
eukprot:sb/3467095/